MKSNKWMIAAAGMVLSAAAAQAACPDLTGKFLKGPTQYSSCVNGYEIKMSADNMGRKVYEMSKITCGTASSIEEYVVGATTQAGDTSATPTATGSISCSGNQLVMSTSMMGMGTKKTFGLDANGNLVIASYNSVAGISHKEGELTFARK